VQFAVEVTQGEHKHRGGLIAGKADDHAVRGAPSFDLDPLAPPGPVASICALCHDAFEAGNFAQPLTRQIRVRRLQDQLQARMQVVEDVYQAMSPSMSGSCMRFVPADSSTSKTSRIAGQFAAVCELRREATPSRR
jgi:hypothetical protein